MIPPLLRRLALALLLALALVAGAAADPFEVATYADLCKVGTGVDGWTADADYIQTADIQCPAGSNFVPIGGGDDPFTGSYDGRGYVIRDLFIDISDRESTGLFGWVEDGAVITNVTLEEFSITAVREVGGLVGCLYGEGVIIENCTVSGTISGGKAYTGGLIGYAEYATITDCHADVKILGEMIYEAGGLIGTTYYCNVTSCSAHGDITYADGFVGGLIGYCYDSTITDCHAHGDVAIDPDARYQDGPNGGLIGTLDTSSAFNCSATGNVIGGEWATGGLVGYGRQSTVARCYASGNVRGYEDVGGLIGYYEPRAEYSIEDCYATGAVVSSGSDARFCSAGGLIGLWNQDSLASDGQIKNVYSTGSVSAPVLPAEVVGGLIGQIKYGTGITEDCFWDTETSGQATSAGGATGKTTAELQTLATFAGWNIATPATYTDEVWYIVEGEDYPRLAWEGLPTLPPVAAFSAAPTSGIAPLTVQFTDASTGSPTAWSWNFGDGGTSDQQHPSHTYNEPGTYTVNLTATNAGGSDTETKTGYITVTAPVLPPVAAFSAAPTTGTAPLTVQFTDASTNDPTAWSWTFGDGGTSDQQHPSHTYNEPGTYTVNLTATNAGGSDTETKTGYITVTAPILPPVAAFSASPTTGIAPLTVQFTDASTGSPTSWHWDFGDGRTSIAQSPRHTYSTAGTYTVNLTATNAGGSDTETKNGYITVSAAPPTAPTEAAGSPAFPYSQQRKETLSFLLMCWGGLAFVGVFCIVIFLVMNGAQRGSGGI
mgnify:CR=1 FL=1